MQSVMPPSRLTPHASKKGPTLPQLSHSDPPSPSTQSLTPTLPHASLPPSVRPSLTHTLPQSVSHWVREPSLPKSRLERRKKKKTGLKFFFFWLGHELGPIPKRGPWDLARASPGPEKKPGTLNGPSLGLYITKDFDFLLTSWEVDR